MKKLLLAVMAFMTLGLAAQEAQKVSSAIIAYKNNEIAEAKDYMDQATAIIEGKNASEISEKVMSKYYYNRGLIYLRIASSPDAEVRALDPNANAVAAESYLSLFDYESRAKKARYTDKAIGDVAYIANNYVTLGDMAYEKEDYSETYSYYISAYNFKSHKFLPEPKIDTNLLFNAAVVATQAGELELAIDHYKSCIEFGYTGISWTAFSDAAGGRVRFPSKEAMDVQISMGIARDPQQNPSQRAEIFRYLIDLLKKEGRTDEFKSTLEAAREEFPDNADLVRLELQDLLEKKDYTGVMAKIDEAIAIDAGNVVYYFLKGSIQQTEMKDYEAALASYNKAIEIDPEYADAYYNAGMVYIDMANELVEKMAALSYNETTKYNKYKEQQTEWFELSIPYFEKSLELLPNDEATIKALQQVYRKTGNHAKFKEMQDLLDAM